ncbi:cytidylyltransferase domain-containing protein [Cylindrospermopsis curvispora]|uniref:cytidylyltransferase domain-containing protein n=1 Tax=Cylindrospermopsis curvispora TaxID=747548 RepID=UPI001CA6DD56|nr:glycosyltransferase family protein [Cylindrospermopsis curvispora]
MNMQTLEPNFPLIKTVIIVQARMTSTRLPGKILKQVLGKPLLQYQIERLQGVKLADEIVIATTTNKTDAPIIDLCDRLSVAYFRGSEADVLERYYQAAVAHQAKVVVRVTSDCPLIDPQVVNRVIDYYLKNHSQYDYVSNSLERTYPRGMDTEVFPFSVLQEAFVRARSQPDREHVTPFIYRQPVLYRLGHVLYSQDCSHHRWTVDTAEDFELIQKIIEAVYPNVPNFTLEDCLRLLGERPEWYLINSHIEQKKYGE